MKKLVIIVALLYNGIGYAQNFQQQKTDSVANLVKKYFNEKEAGKIYELTGQDFRNHLSAEVFKNVSETNLFSLGKIKKMVLETNESGINKYKVFFNSTSWTMLLSLDKNDKIETFLFQPYRDEKAKKNYKVSSSNPLQTILDKEVDTKVMPYISLKSTVGLSIAILKNGKAYYYGYGETKKDNKIIPGEHTLFEIGSLSKTFTSTLFAIAIDEGKVKADDQVNKYLPDSISLLQFEGVPITLEMLSNHTSGLPRMPSNFKPTDISNPYKDYDINELYSFLKHYKLTRKPGSKYEYSNLAAGTLGVILEKVFHKKYEELVEQYICKPLEMTETKEFLQKTDSSKFAQGYDMNGLPISQWDFKALQAAGALRSTTSDLIKYAKANLGDAPPQLLKAIKLTHNVTYTEGETKVGLGWHFIQPGKDELLFHNGETGGYHSYFAVDLSKKLAVVILSNSARGTESAGNQLMKWLEENE